MAGIWVAGALPALVVAFVRRPKTTSESGEIRHANRFGIVVVLALAALGFALIASVTVRFLSPDAEEAETNTDTLTQILEDTTARTAEGGSNFTPPSVSSPVSWPYASIRTLLRPLPQEVTNIAQAVAAVEIVALLVLLFISRRRIYNIPRLLVSNPYVTFVVTTLFIAGLAYSSFANLGLLTRQKSLLFPLLLLLPCLPMPDIRRGRWTDRDVADDDDTAAPVTPTRSSSQTVAAAPAGALARTTTHQRRDFDDLWTKAT
jgi:hypothetical protein